MHALKSIVAAATVFVVLGLAPPRLHASNVVSTWTSATSGSWNINGNWTNVPALGGFPNDGNLGVATYDAVISPTGPAYTLTLATAITVENLLLNSANATLSHTTGTLTANTGFNLLSGTYQLNGGTLANTVVTVGGGTFAIVGSTSNQLNGVTVNGAFSITTFDTGTKIAGGTTFTTAHLSASLTSLGFAPGQTMNGTVLFDGAASSNRGVEMNGTAGSLTIGAAGVIRTATGLTGDGMVGGAVLFGGNMTLLNQGLISSQVSGRTIAISPTGFTNQGTIEAINGGILTINPTNIWNNAGTINVNTGTVNLAGSNGIDATAGIGTFTNGGGTVNLNTTIFNSGNILTLNSSTGSWTLNGGAIMGGTLDFANGATLLFTNNTSNLLTGVTINGDLTLANTSNDTKIAGGTTFVTAHLGAANASLGYAPGQTFASTILFEGASGGTRGVEMSGTTGMFTIGTTGVIRTAAGFGGSASIGSPINYSGGNMTLLNQGLISSQVSGRTITVNPVSFTNQGTGTVEAINGGLAVISATNWSNASGGILQALNGSTLSLSGAWSSAGTININSSTLNLGGSFTTAGFNQAAFTNTSGTINLTGALDNTSNTLTLNASTGSWTLNGGSITGGTVNFANGATLLFIGTANLLSGVAINGDFNLTSTSTAAQIAGGTTFVTAHLGAGNDSVAFAPGQTLTGAVLFEGANGARGVEMNGTTGVLTISNTGVIRTAAGFGGIATIGGGLNFSNGNMTLINNGLISSQVSGRTITVNPVSFTNQGTVEAINGGLAVISATNWSNASGGILQALNGSTLSLSGNWSNPAGSISINNSTLNLGGTFTTAGFNPAAFTNTAGTVNVTGTINNAGNTVTLNASTGSWTLNGGTFSGGTLNFANGASLLFVGTANLLTGVTINGDFTLANTSSSAQIAGGTTFVTAHLGAGNDSVAFAPGQTLTGAVLFEGALGGARGVEMNGTTGTLTIGNTGVIRTVAAFGGIASIGGGLNFSNGNMTLTNNGLISSQVSGRTITVNPVSFTNQGTVEAINGGLTIISATNWSNTTGGILQALNGSTLSLSGNWSNPAGSISLNNSTLNLGGTFTTTGFNPAAFTNTAGTVNITGTINNTGTTLTLNASTGSWTLSGGTISGGSLAFGGGQTLLFTNNPTNLLTGLTVNGDLTLANTSNDTQIGGGTTFVTAHLAGQSTSLGFTPSQTLSGTIVFEGAAVGARVVEMNGTTGTFTIAASGVIQTAVGLAGDGQIGGPLNYAGGHMTLVNQGLISSQTNGRTININAVSLSNTGTVEARNGGLVLFTAPVTQFSAGTLAGGTWNTFGNSTMSGTGIGAITTNNASVQLDGLNSTFASINSIMANGGTFIVSGGRNFTTAGALANSGTLTSGIGSTLTLAGPFTWSTGILNGGGVITANAGLALTGSGGETLSAAIFNNLAGQTTTASGTGAFTIDSSGVFNNAGTYLAQTNSGIASGSGTNVFNNSGTFTRNTSAGTFAIAPVFNSTGTLNLNTGTLQLSGGGTESGPFNVASTTNLVLQGATFTFDAASSIAGAGSVTFAGGTQNINGGYTAGGLTTLSGGTVNFGNSATLGSLAVSAGNLNSTTGKTLDIGNPFTWSGGTLGGAGTFNANGGVGLTGAGGENLNGATFNNISGQTATASGSGALTLTNGATFNNAGSYLAQTDGGIAGGSGTNVFNNSGTFTRNTSAGTFTISTLFNSTGTLNLNTGALQLSGGGTATGASFNVASGTTLALQNGTFVFDAASSLTGAGNVSFTGGTQNINGGYTVTGLTSVSGSTVGFATSATFVSLSVTSGALNVVGGKALGVTNPIAWSGGTLGGGGTFNANGGVGMTGLGGEILNGAIFNNIGGQTAAESGSGALSLTNGATFNNAGTFLAPTDAGIASGTGTNVFNNNGIFTRNTSSGVFSVAAGFNNAGTLNVNSGTLQLNGSVTQFSAGTLTGGIWNVTANATLGGSGLASITTNSATVSLTGTNSVFAAINSLATNNGSFSVAGGRNFTPPGALANSGTLAAGSGSTCTIAGLFTWTAGTLNGGGTFQANGGIALSGSAGETLSGSILNNAVGKTATESGTGALTLANGATFNNAGSYLAQSDAGIAVGSGTNTFNNTGSFTRNTSSGAFGVAGAFNNAGTINVNTGTLQLTGIVPQFSAGTLTGGTWNVATNATLGGSGIGAVNTNNATVSLTGANSVFAATDSLATNSGNFAVNGGRNFTTAGGLSNAGTITAGSGSAFAITGLFTWTAGTLNGAGTFNANAGIALSGSAGTTLDTATLNNATNQTATESGTGALTLVNGAIFNNAGTFLASTDAGIISGSGNNVFNNSGVFTRNSSPGTFVIATAFNNSGTVNVNTGALQFNGPVTQVAGGQLLIQDGTSATFNSSFVNAGTVIATGATATLTFNGPVTNNGVIIVSGGATLDVTGSPFTNNGTLDVITGRFTPPNGFVNNGVFLDASAVKIKSSSLAGSNFSVLIDSNTGHTYQLQRSSSLSTDTFTNIGPSQAGSTGTTLSFNDPSASSAEGFYRVLVNP